MKRISRDYIELRKSISTYVDRYASATKEQNKLKLERLAKLKPSIDINEHNKKEYYKLRDELTISNGGFAMKHVMRYNNILNDDTCISELYQEATIGIIESIDTFNIEKKTAFTTYAFYHVKKRIIDYIKKNKLVKAPRDIARNIKHVKEIQEDLLTKTGKNPSAHEIRDALRKNKGLDVKIDTITNILILLDLNSSGFEDSFISEYTDQISYDNNDSQLFRNMELNILSQISKLPIREQEIIKLRFGIAEDYPHSIEEIKYMLEVTDEQLKRM